MSEQFDSEEAWLLLFVANGFCERSVTAVLQQAECESLFITTVGLTDETVHGLQAEPYLPHYSLAQIVELSARMNKVTFDAILLAGGIRSINHLLADPRLHHFLERLADLQLPIGICRPFPDELIVRSPFYKVGDVRLQERDETAVFLEQFMAGIVRKRSSAPLADQRGMTSLTAASDVVE